jgi:hypothetical protein
MLDDIFKGSKSQKEVDLNSGKKIHRCGQIRCRWHFWFLLGMLIVLLVYFILVQTNLNEVILNKLVKPTTEEPVATSPIAKPTTTTTTPSPTVTSINDKTVGQYNTSNYKYKLKLTASANLENVDQKLIRINRKNYQEEVIVKSIKAAIPALKKQSNLVLMNLAQPLNSDKVFFQEALLNTDAPGGAVYVFDVVSKNFKKLSDVNTIYGGFGGFALAPDATRFAWTPEGNNEQGKVQTMYLVNLVNDSYDVAVQLGGKETFNGGTGALSSSYDISWIDNDIIKFTVYDQTKKKNNQVDFDGAIIEERVIDLLSPTPSAEVYKGQF